ncbi:MAG: 1-acyl-sn-glycerol-3-phosphate acyltransferase [Nitrospinae bacterium]|nr:1-acyl-sn-glycerol-3-phosphate acyltransferase [Nitrospinota bacterium]
MTIIIVTTLIGSIVILFSIFDKKRNFAYLCARLWGRTICKLNGVEVQIDGLENIHRERVQVFVSNHQGFFDIFSLLGYLPIRFIWMAKEGLFRIPILGLGMRKAGYISVDRSNRKKSYHSFMNMIEKVKEGYSVVIFPEGSRTLDGNIGRFKKGSLLIATRTGTPIVPVTISGSYEVMKRGEMRLRSRLIRIKIDRPIETSNISKTERDNLIEKVREIIIANYTSH